MSVSKWRVWWITPKPWSMAASLPSVFDGRKVYHIGHPVVLIYRKQLVKRSSQSRSQTLLHVQEWGSGVLSDFSCHRGRGYYPNLPLESGFAELYKQSYFELTNLSHSLFLAVPGYIAWFPGYSQIFCSCGEKSVEGLVPSLCHGLEMVDLVSYWWRSL